MDRAKANALSSRVIRQLLDSSCAVIRIGDTSTVRDFTFVDDTVGAFLAIGLAPDIEFGHAYNAGSGKAVSVAEMIDLVIGLVGLSKPLDHDADRMRPSNSEVRALHADSSRLAAAVGWRPKVDLCEGLTRTVKWWRDRLASGRASRTIDLII
jgi:UDP-glucose 4-epimerase